MDIGTGNTSVAGVELNTAILAVLAILVGNGFILWSSLPARHRLPALLVGVLVLSVGTTIPELAIVIRAALGDVRTSVDVGYSATSVDNYTVLSTTTFPVAVILGSCLSNLLLVTGVAGLVLPKPFVIERFTRGRDMTFLFLALIVLFVGVHFSDSDRIKPIWIGFSLVALGILYVIVVGVTELSGGDAPPTSDSPDGGADFISTFFYFVLGAVLLVLGVHLIFVESPSVIDAVFKPIDLKQWPIAPGDRAKYALYGLLFIGLAVALPELIATLFARLRGQADVVAGNLIGASVFNILGVLGIGIILSHGRMVTGLDWTIFAPDLIVLAIAAVLLAIFFRTESQLDAWEGLILVGIYVAYWVLRFTSVIPPFLPSAAPGGPSG